MTDLITCLESAETGSRELKCATRGHCWGAVSPPFNPNPLTAEEVVAAGPEPFAKRCWTCGEKSGYASSPDMLKAHTQEAGK